MSNIIKDNKEQQGETTQETQPHNTNPTSELIILLIATIFFAVIGIIQLVSIAGRTPF